MFPTCAPTSSRARRDRQRRRPSPVATASGANPAPPARASSRPPPTTPPGVAGVCPRCTVRCVRLLAERGRPVPISADVAAMNFALDVGASVVSNSWGFSEAIPVRARSRRRWRETLRQRPRGRGTLVWCSPRATTTARSPRRALRRPRRRHGRVLNNFDRWRSSPTTARRSTASPRRRALTTDLTGARAARSPTTTAATFGGTSSACLIIVGRGLALMSRAPTLDRAGGARRAQRRRARPLKAQPDDAGFDPAVRPRRRRPGGRAARKALQRAEPSTRGLRRRRRGRHFVATDARASTSPAADGGVFDQHRRCGCRGPGRGVHPRRAARFARDQALRGGGAATSRALKGRQGFVVRETIAGPSTPG